MLGRLPARARRRTVAGDKGYDAAGFVADVRGLGFTPHFAPDTTRQRSTIDGRTTRHAGHEVSQRIRKRIEEPFGWMKTVAGGRKLRYIGRRQGRPGGTRLTDRHLQGWLRSGHNCIDVVVAELRCSISSSAEPEQDRELGREVRNQDLGLATEPVTSRGRKGVAHACGS